MLPEATYLGSIFHELFRCSSENVKSKSEWSRKRRKRWDAFYRKRGKEGNDSIIGPPEVELPGNPSEFAVFAHVRQAVLEAWAHKATQVYLSSSSSPPIIESAYEGDSESDVTEIYHPQPTRVPKIVGIGLRCVLELIRESRASHPMLCTKTLAALLDVLQGQQPQDLQNEPAEVIDPLFDLLLDLATCYAPEPTATDDGNHLTAIACSCLLSLVIVRGSTGKLLSSAAALLMCPKQLANQNIHLPFVMTALQRSIYAVLLGKITRPDWLTHGVPIHSKTDSFTLKNTGLGNMRSLASDGQYLYMYTSRGLYKIGSGHGGTIKGHIYYCLHDFYHDEKSWMGFANGWLWLKISGKKGCELLRIDRDPLKIVDTIRLDIKDSSHGVWFSDADQLGIITSVSDDGFIVKTMNPNVKPIICTSELTLKLTRKCIDVMGTSSFDEELGNKGLNTDFDEDILSIVSGKEFGLVRLSNGKVFYSGKASSIGMKNIGSSSRWFELPIPKAGKAQHVAVGHEGLHAVIITEDGGVFFCGTARRGEDGDLSKIRRQPKAVKPKKIVKVEDECIVHAAANNGTTALVTRSGRLLMFGKDTVHCNSSTGQVLGTENLQITQIALGKAHAVALTAKGIVYTFGINNKGQCGRDFSSQLKDVLAMETAGHEFDKDDEFEWEDAQDAMCPAGKHQWRHDLCMICTICRECTGYSISCLSAMRPNRLPGQECGCGEGDSGCSICGCCKVCAKENVDNSELSILGPSGAGDSSGTMRLDLIFNGDSQAVKHSSRLQDHLQRRLEERKQRQSRKTSKHYCALKIKNSCSRPASCARSGSSVSLFRAPAPVKFSNLINEEQAGGSDAERDASRITSLAPAPIALPYTCPAVQIACGLHHTIVLTQIGEVFTFGSNIYGQLGVGDVLLRGGPVKVRLPCLAQSVAAGSNHSVVLTVKGEVYTFGSYQKGQLGRKCSKSGTNDPSTSSFSRKSMHSDREGPWYAIPGTVPGIGPHSGRKATWVGAAGDQTFIKVDESLINSLSLEQATVTGNKTCLLLVPKGDSNTFQSLAISRRDGCCAIFSGADQAHLVGSPVCLDPLYNVLWSYQESTNSVSCYNVIASEAKGLEALSHSMFDPDLLLPTTPGCLVKRSQAALHLLGALDTLAQAHYYKLEVGPDVVEKQPIPTKAYTLQDFSVINRFESHGGGWGYSGHSIEAIRFMSDTDIVLGGFGLFGGRGEYTAKIKVLDIGVDGGEQESDGEVIAETDDIPYECGPRQKFAMLFEEPVFLHGNRWYIAWARISGPSSDCGSNGQALVTSEDQISFYFKASKKSNNGTDVNAGQIPQLLYKVNTQETKPSPRQIDTTEPVFVLSKEFSSAVTRECFQSLTALLHWGWSSLKSGYLDLNGSLSTLSTHAEHERLTRLVYINRACLRLIHLYANEIYPNQVFSKKGINESVRLAECIGDVRALLRQMLSDRPITGIHKELTAAVLEECHRTFVLIFHAMYPTPYLKWNILCELLSKADKTGFLYTQHDKLLSAVLEALCCPTIRLRSALPVLSDSLDPSMRQVNISDNSGLALSGADHHYPVLVEQMSYRTQVEKTAEGVPNWGWKEVLDKLLDLAVLPVKRALGRRQSAISKELVKNCCNLLARILAELASQSSGYDEDLQGSCGRVLHVTPSRFLRTNQTRTWNTGNGSPDAICFSVDKPGVVIAGVCVYGGNGILEYELELLDDQSNSGTNDPSPGQRWTSLEVVKGTFGPDDCVSDVAELKFAKPVLIKENTKYAIRLRNQGGRTSNGDGGLSSVKGPDGITFSFSTCSLSFNGTTQTRGQIPQILYYSNPQDGTLQHTSKAVAEHQARKTTLSMTTAVINRCSSLMWAARERADDIDVIEILGNACIITTLLPLVFAHIGPLGTSDPRSAVQVMNLIQELLPHVAALNLLDTNCGADDNTKMTTSNHYAWVESDHPYKPASVSNYRVSFPDSVKWMAIEFSPGCGTAQSEDSLKLYIPSASKEVWERQYDDEDSENLAPVPYWRVLRTLRGGTTWPQNAVMLPGNEVIFSLETASDYLKNEKACNYGFRCLVVGYEWNTAPNSGLKHLEFELAFVAGMCAASLIKKDLLLPPTSDEMEDEADLAEEAAMLVANEHSSLLVQGFALAQIPTISQALDGILPLSCHSNERLFLRDFIQCTTSTSGGRLARWLQPDSYVDPSKCEVLYSRDDVRCGWPTIVTILTKDQYCELVHVPNLRVEVKAVPIDKKTGGCDAGRKMRRVSGIESTSLKPPQDVPYEMTVEDKICYHSITVMKAYENFSFEELRYLCPTAKRTSENMLVRPYNDGSYCATWTPSHTGWYSILVTIDGYSLEEIHKAEVKEPPQGVTPPAHSLVKKTAHQPSKVRKFVSSHSAGLRVRAHPSLQSEQIGVVQVNGTIAFIDEIHNDDGVWLRLNYETMKQYCPSLVNGINEAWCLQYNQHLGKTLLLPVEEPKRILDQVIKETLSKKLTDLPPKDKTSKSVFPAMYTVVKCGAACHNVRSKPCLQAPPIGMMVLGNQVEVLDQVVNVEGTWVKINPEVASKFCFNHVTEAWSLARSPNNELYLRQEPSLEAENKIFEGPSPKKGYDFSARNLGNLTGGETSGFSFAPPHATPPQSGHSSADPFVFGFYVQDGKCGSEKKILQRSVKEESKSLRERCSSPRNGCTETVGVSVKDLIKAIGESRTNGNGETPPGTPPRRTSGSSSPKTIGLQQGRSHSPKAQVLSPRSSSPNFQFRTTSPVGEAEKTSRSSSPMPIPGNRRRSPRTSFSGIGPSSPTSLGYSPLVSGGGLVDSQFSLASQRRGSTQSDTSALVSSLTRDLSQSPLTKDLSPSPSSSSLLVRSESSVGKKDYFDDLLGRKDTLAENTKKNFCNVENTKAVMQIGTQTSPEGGASVKGHFSIGSAGKNEKISPKLIRKDRNLARSSKRAMSPASQMSTSGEKLNVTKQPVKVAMSPSIAESLRAIFSAFLWQEGIVHDAMACASFLKFHPTLPKQGALVVTRRIPSAINATKRGLSREQKRFQRHSVEVSTSGTYLHIQPSTLESLTRSAANANASRTRKKQQSPQEASIKEEATAENSTKSKEVTDNLNKFKSEDSGGDGGTVTVSVLPPALKGLVIIWEELSATFLRAFEQQTLLPSPSLASKFARNIVLNREKVATRRHVDVSKNKAEVKKSNRKKKDWKPVVRLNSLGEACELVAPLLAAASERETVCELCGGIYPHPVTYHMRQSHPGCGSLAGGKGYNSSGNFCVGWAGHCGDGGVGGNSWYLICDTCREKYIRLKKEGMTSKDKKKGSGKKKAAIITPASSTLPLISPIFVQNNCQEPHIIMKDNALFLLDLAGSSNSVISNEQRRSVPANSMVASSSENASPPDSSGPFSPVGSFQCLPALGRHVKEQELEEMLQRQLPQELDISCNGNPLPNSSFDGSDSEDQKGRSFHRSASMGTSGVPWTKKDGDGRIILSRKRNNSSSGEVAEGGSSLLCRPSATLQKLIPGLDESAIISNEDRMTLDLLRRPSVSFILRRHPLFALRFAMKHSLRKATCRLYAFQALNWFLHNVTQPICLHDLLWWFVASLSPPSNSLESESVEDQVKKEDGEIYKTCEHPLNDITFAGDAALPLWRSFHRFLQTVADLMFLLPPSCPLQTMAVRCWGLKFSQVDHAFLHRSQVFNNISKILSRSEEESDDISVSMHESASSQHLSAMVEGLKDITPEVEIKVSSRQAMVGSLIDNSTETFWESGDEDRNKTKFMTIACPPKTIPKMVYIHIDNCRDLANKVASVTFSSGPNLEELHKIRQMEVESRSTGWISSPILDSRHTVLKLEFKGPDNSLRVRQVRVLGESEESLVIPQRSAVTVQQRLCESETLKVFRSITAHVFGKLISGDTEESSEPEGDRAEDNNDLKEHMVGILFSRSKLTHLQKQVCMHIVHAIRKETSRVREEWECLLCSPVPSETKPSDTYAFEMLSMVLALSGSSVGRVYISHQYGLLTDLLSLLHTGSARVQRQVTALLRRVLPEVAPATLANVLGVEKLPPSNFSIASTSSKQEPFDVYKIGILDVFLSIIAKSLTVQAKVKGREVKGVTSVTLATAIHPRDPMGLRWWLRGCISRKLAEDIIQLLNDMSTGKLSESWANVTKAAIAENIINLTRLDESKRGPTECLKTPTLWLALASLCVLDKEHVERLSSGQWTTRDGEPPPPRPTCSNHDDNATGAIIQCSVCGNLCADCDRYLHLHKRTRMHQRQVCKEEEEAIKVDLHEGCGRTKLFWVLALADSCTLKALVEFREGSRNKSASTGVCRFCGTNGNSGLLAIGNVCADKECQEHAKNICNKIHPCGHVCGGLAGEVVCLPCLQNCRSNSNLKQDADDMCMICFTEALSCAPAIQLHCGHVFHGHCAKNALVRRWAGPRITFSFSQCPICKSPMKHSVLSDLLKPIEELYEDVRRKALMRLEYEGLHRAVAITSPGAKFYNDPASYAMDRYAYYVCYKCNKAYYGGEARCDVDMNGDYDPSELVCGGCSDVARAQMCPKHGTDFLEYKCRYCCSVAVFFCFGTTHFCNSCHDDFQRVTNIPKGELPSCPAGPKAKQLDGEECPLHVNHPPTGEEFALGCGVCRNAHTF